MQILHDYLKLTGMTQTKFAKRLGMGEGELSMLLNGKRNPGLKILMRLHESTGIELDNLVKGSLPANGQGNGA